ncbi:hypothetical protein CQW23_03573 [Capsicum baccatum]|uniref:beta-ketoacyl-[acyl-carrier-protein] synthase I n=1 Tax=Capsicum baccatum TaxID=33114 RepID=A0A2G2XC78_CAPBA|nr:hypothetical protein CQW23_03573 [Capsicum baccatum]
MNTSRSHESLENRPLLKFSLKRLRLRPHIGPYTAAKAITIQIDVILVTGERVQGYVVVLNSTGYDMIGVRGGMFGVKNEIISTKPDVQQAEGDNDIPGDTLAIPEVGCSGALKEDMRIILLRVAAGFAYRINANPYAVKFIPSLEDFVKIPFYEPVIIEVLGYLHKVIPKDGSSFKGGASINSRNQPEFGRVAYLDCHMDTLKAQISYRVSIPTDFFYILYKIGSGVVLCMEKVLVQSRVKSEDVNYINAHVASTPAGDLNKYQAILHCFGQNPERLLGKFVSVEDDAKDLGHAIVDRKTNEHTIVHCSKDIEEVEWYFLDFGEKNLIACGCLNLICKIGIEADSIGRMDLSNSALALT